MNEQKDAEGLSPKNNESGGFRIRLRVRTQNALNTDQSCLTTCIDGREVTIKSFKDSQLSLLQNCGVRGVIEGKRLK